MLLRASVHVHRPHLCSWENLLQLYHCQNVAEDIIGLGHVRDAIEGGGGLGKRFA